MSKFSRTLPRRPAKGLLISTFIFSVFVNILMLTGPLFMLQVYDRVLSSRSEATLVALFALVALLYSIMGLLDYARSRLMARVAARLRTALDATVFDAVMHLSRDPRKRVEAAGALRHLDAVQSFLTAPVAIAFFDIPWTPFFIAAIFIFHPYLGWLAVAGGCILVVVSLLNNWLTQKKVKAASTASQKAHSLADEARSSSELVHAQGMSLSMSQRWSAQQNKALNQSIGASDWTGVFSALTKAFRLFLQSAMLAVGAWLVLKNEMTGGAMIAGSILLGRGLAPIEQSIGQWPNIQRARTGWREVKSLLREMEAAKATTILPVPKPHFTMSGVTVFTPGASKPTLSGITFEVKPGQAVGIIGNSGMGKSTIAKTMVGLIPPFAGEVRLGGATLDQYDPDQLGGLIGYLPQSVTLFAGTILENIARMSTDPDEDKVFKAARQANAHEMILSLPEGYQTKLLGSGSQLSGGQQQRIALARALYGDPVLLVLDEPNSALDNTGTEALNRAVREFRNDGRAVVIMTHRPQAIAECDQLVVVEQGKIKANGPRDEVLRSVLKNAGDVQRTVREGGQNA